MPRPRVLSLSFFGGQKNGETNSAPSSPTFGNAFSHKRKPTLDTFSASALGSNADDSPRDSPSPSSALQQRNRSDSRASRPVSGMYTMPAMAMETSDTIPELQPIYGFLNKHSNKLYQEGYFLKLHDLDSRGRPSTDRTWTECFAQLAGTVLSLWDAAALDAAGETGEVLPTFINLSDATIKMIESLPMNTSRGGTLQNVLSISTAASNRYLLHFNSLNSLTQWTAGIRLAMYEHATLQEAYTGCLIAGKGKLLNNIKNVMEKLRFAHEDWARVRFGAGTPWRRCWCVISPPSEKEIAKAQKSLKKRNNYDRKVVIPKGDIKFYESRRVNKKTKPIATISDAFSAYAIYPSSKALVDQSTLVKLEGLITIHGQADTTTEGFIFVMPEVHPAVTGFEMMLRWLFPVWDTFALYGRPNRLIADTLDQRGLMFAMPRERRYGYLDTLDVSGLIHTEGSQAWNERQWRSELKKLTSHRMNAADADSPAPRRSVNRNSLPGVNRSVVVFDPDRISPASQSSPSSRKQSPAPPGYEEGPRRASNPTTNGAATNHKRSVSEAMGYRRFQADVPSRLSIDSNADSERPPRPPAHGTPVSLESHSEEELPGQFAELMAKDQPVTPVALPPEFMHNPSSKPAARPYQAPELRRATSGMDAATLAQMQDAVQRPEDAGDPPHNGYPHQGHNPTNEVSAQRDSRVPEADISSRKDMVNKLHQNRLLPTIPASPLSPGPQPELGAPFTYNGTPTKAERPRTAASDSSSARGLGDHVPDADALERVLQNDRTSTMQSSIPDYDSVDEASFKSLLPTPTEPEKPRAGRLKTVGDPTVAEGTSTGHNRSRSKFDTFNEDREVAQGDAIPTVDFGPTYSHKPSVRPSSTGAFASSTTPENASPSAGQRNSYFSGRTTPNLIPRKPLTPGATPSPDRNQRRSVAWQPTGSPAEPDNRQSLTPEQWVQNRASWAAQPVAHQRSTPNLRPERPQGPAKRLSATGTTPPGTRRMSGDWMQQAPQANVDQSRSRPIQQGGGLYGALSALEQEKAASKGGHQNMAAQRAIALRQQQQAQEMQARMRYEQQMQQATHAAQYQLQVQQQQQQMQYGRGGQRMPQNMPMQQPPPSGYEQQQRPSQYGAYTPPSYSRPNPR